jgi:hypothetical protein
MEDVKFVPLSSNSGVIDAMEQNCQLACHCNYHLVLGLFATSGGQMQTPLPKCRVLPDELLWT